ncbi:MAG: TM2 domain-containing protein [Bacilli bacterium]|jgi:TM2 domain-containing membrane protein YozV
MPKYCSQCGAEIPDGADFCPKCGASITGKAPLYTPENTKKKVGGSTKSRGIATILCALGFFCVAGIHRLYVGKIGTGILWLLTGGLFYIGTIIDLVSLLTGDFTDIDGEKLTEWNMD